MSTLESNYRTYSVKLASICIYIHGDAHSICLTLFPRDYRCTTAHTARNSRCTSVHFHRPAADWHEAASLATLYKCTCSATKDIHNLALQMTRKIVVLLYICSNCISLAAAVPNVYVPPSTKRFGDLNHFNGPSADKAGRPCVKRFRDDYSLLFKNPLRNLQL